MTSIQLTELQDRIIRLINKHSLNPAEYAELLGKLLYIIGASLAGYKEGETPDMELIKSHFLQEPTLDLTMILSGIQALEWAETFRATPKLSNLGKKERKEIY